MGAYGIDISRMQSDFRQLSQFGRVPGAGVTRPSFGPAFLQARQWLKGEMERVDLETRIDVAGNLFGRLDHGEQTVMMGSHLDSVPNGGLFDGSLGLLAALESVRVLRERRAALTKSVEIAAFSDEEGAYYSLLGSRAMTGDLDLEALAKSGQERYARLALAIGADPTQLRTARRSMDAVAAYLELHVEQGPRLDLARTPIGVVKRIVGLSHYELVFRGHADHAGTTPLDVRKDAFLGAAQFALAATEWVRKSSPQSTFNVGEIYLLPGASNVVPGEARLAVEFRDASLTTLQDLQRGILGIGEQVASARGLGFAAAHLSTESPVALDTGLQQVIHEVAATCGFKVLLMDSGAGHDAQVLSLHTKAGMIFVPSVGGRSHCPEEESRWGDIEKGTAVLLESISRLACD